jgi:hypothetical protein
MPDISQDRSQESGKQVLENLKSLRFFEGEEKDFWTRLLLNASLLCKSPVAFFMARENGKWSVRQEIYGNESIKA